LSTDPAPEGVDGRLAHAILSELAAVPDGMSLQRLCKRTGLRMSILLRALAWMGSEAIGALHGRGWLTVIRDREPTLARITPAGRQYLSEAARGPD
jgi:hypothetical protein